MDTISKTASVPLYRSVVGHSSRSAPLYIGPNCGTGGGRPVLPALVRPAPGTLRRVTAEGHGVAGRRYSPFIPTSLGSYRSVSGKLGDCQLTRIAIVHIQNTIGAHFVAVLKLVFDV